MRRSTLAAVVFAMFAAFVSPNAVAADYLPLGPGARWELRAPNVPAPMVFEVTGRDGDSFVVRWDNPWVKASFRFREDAGRVLLTGLDMGQGVAPMPGGTVYFDFTARAGATWKNAVGTMRVRARDARVSAGGADYRDCVEIETIDNQGQSMFWTFAPGIGFVRFGEGKTAFVLSSVSQPRAVAAAPSAGGARGVSRAQRVLIGLDANPPESAGVDARTRA